MDQYYLKWESLDKTKGGLGLSRIDEDKIDDLILGMNNKFPEQIHTKQSVQHSDNRTTS